MKNLSELVKQAEIKRKRSLHVGALIITAMGSILALFALVMSGLPENFDTQTAWHVINLFGLFVALFGVLCLRKNQN